MKSALLLTFPVAALCSLPAIAIPMDKEYLTPKEIESIQDAQELDKRVKIYLEAAALRLKTAEERLNGKESEPGNPMEFFSVEEMVDGYYRIIRSVMLNLDGAVQSPQNDKGSFVKALKNLKESTEKAQNHLAILKRIAEDKRMEALWNAVNRGIDITTGAHDGATEGLSNNPDSEKKKGGPARKKKGPPTLGPP